MRRLGPRRRRAEPQVARRAGRRRDRHGRGVRGLLVPPDVPLYRTRAERFDDLVLDVVEHLEPRWGAELAGIEFAVEDVPALGDDPDAEPTAAFDSDVISDGEVPLARVVRPGEGGRPAEDGPAPRRPAGGLAGSSRPEGAPPGATAAPRIVLYRRPLETRARDAHDLAHLVHDVVVEQVAHVLGISPEDLDGPDDGHEP